jgi:hypothetical protein
MRCRGSDFIPSLRRTRICGLLGVCFRAVQSDGRKWESQSAIVRARDQVKTIADDVVDLDIFCLLSVIALGAEKYGTYGRDQVCCLGGGEMQDLWQ